MKIINKINTNIFEFPASKKLLLMLVFSVGIYLTKNIYLLTSILIFLLITFQIAKISWRKLRPLLYTLITISLLLLLLHWSNKNYAVLLILKFADLMLLGLLLYHTTPMTDLIAAFERFLKPFAKLGINPEKVSFMLFMTFRSVTLIQQEFFSIKEAQQARGKSKYSLTFLLPLLVKIFRQAENIAEAVATRITNQSLDEVKNMVFVTLMAALSIALALVPAITLPLIPVSITLQSIGVMLAGSLLGAKRGAFSMLILLVLIALGMPVLAGFSGGIYLFFSPVGGFLLSWPLAAFIIGWLVEKCWSVLNIWILMLINIIGGIGIIYLIGVPWMAMIAHTQITKAILASLLFIPGDLLKVFIASSIAITFKRYNPLISSQTVPKQGFTVCGEITLWADRECE